MTEKEKLEALFNLKSAFPTDDEKKQFFRAVVEDDRRGVLRTLEKWPAAAQKWRNSSGDMVIAASGDKLKPDMLELLQKHGADIDDSGSPEKRTWPALHLAALHGRPVCLEMLLLHGAKVDVLEEYGQTPLMYATKESHFACADMLVLAGADPNYKGKSFRETAFDNCKSEEMREVLRAAMKKRAEFLANPDGAPQKPKPEAFVPNLPPVPDSTTVKALKRIDLRFKVG